VVAAHDLPAPALEHRPDGLERLARHFVVVWVDWAPVARAASAPMAAAARDRSSAFRLKGELLPVRARATRCDAPVLMLGERSESPRGGRGRSGRVADGARDDEVGFAFFSLARGGGCLVVIESRCFVKAAY
jgi:hypothetical protein